MGDRQTQQGHERRTPDRQPLVDVVPKNIFSSLVDMSMLTVICFAIFFGIVVIELPDEKSARQRAAVR